MIMCAVYVDVTRVDDDTQTTTHSPHLAHTLKAHTCARSHWHDVRTLSWALLGGLRVPCRVFYVWVRLCCVYKMLVIYAELVRTFYWLLRIRPVCVCVCVLHTYVQTDTHTHIHIKTHTIFRLTLYRRARALNLDSVCACATTRATTTQF